MLDALGADYEWMEIDPAFADTAQFCERYGVPEVNSGNTIIVASRREPRQYLCMPGAGDSSARREPDSAKADGGAATFVRLGRGYGCADRA